MSCWRSCWRSQINLKRRLRESQRHLTSSSHFKLMRAEFPAIQKPNKQKIFFSSETKHPPPPPPTNWWTKCCGVASKQFVFGICLRPKCVWKVYLHLETTLWACGGLSQRITYSRDTKHTQGFSHCSIQPLGEQNGWRSGRVINGGEDSLLVNNNPIQDHPSPSLLVDDWPNKPLTECCSGAGHGLSIWSCCLVVAE